MSEPEEGVGMVRYSAKELFAQINSKMDSLGEKVERKMDVLAEKLDAKADHEALIQLEKDLELERSRIDELAEKNAERRGAESWFKAAVLLLLTIAGLLVPVALHYLP